MLFLSTYMYVGACTHVVVSLRGPMADLPRAVVLNLVGWEPLGEGVSTYQISCITDYILHYYSQQ